MRTSWILFSAPFFLLACTGNVDGDCQAVGGGSSAHSPATTTTPDCPATPEANTCTQQGQVCTWTTGKSAVTYTCQMVTDCSPMTYVVWSSPVMKGDGCGGSSCCVPCADAKPGDPCDAPGFKCSYKDTSGGFPPLIGLVCTSHVWTGVAACEN